MVPSAFVPSTALPLTANGKVDRRALPRPSAGRRSGRRAADAAPRNPGRGGDRRDLGRAARARARSASTTTSSPWAATRCSPPACCRGCAQRSASSCRCASSSRPRRSPASPRRWPGSALRRRGGRARPAAARAARRPAADAAAPLSFAQQRLWFLDQLWRRAARPTTSRRLASPGRSTPRRSPRAPRRGRAPPRGRCAPTFAERDGEPAAARSRRRRGSCRCRWSTSRRCPRRGAEAEAARPAPPRRPAAVRPRARDRSCAPLSSGSGAEEHAAPPRPPPHRLRRLVDGGAAARARGALRRAVGRATPSPLPELPLQYADFARLAAAPGSPARCSARQLAYWRGQLAGAPTALELPADRPRPGGREPPRRRPPAAPRRAGGGAAPPGARRGGGDAVHAAPRGLRGAAARAHGGQEDIAGRHAGRQPHPAGDEGLIGFFVNTLVLRVRPRRRPGFRRAAGAGARRRRSPPSRTRTCRSSSWSRSCGRSATCRAPRCSRRCSRCGAPRRSGRSAAASTSRACRRRETTAKLDLTLGDGSRLEEDGGRACCVELEYSTDLFDATPRRCSSRHFATLLPRRRGGAGAAGSRDLPLLGAGRAPPARRGVERHGVGLPRTDRARPLRGAGGSAAGRGRRRPGERARALSYGELDRRSGEIARHLRRLGVAPDARVALVAERSPEMVAALLGVLKAGGAYLPLDPSYPRERLALLLADAAPAAVVGPRHLLAALPGIRRWRRPAWRSRTPRRGGHRGGCPRPSCECRRASREPRLRALHLGLDRHAQGGRGQPSRGGAAGARYGLRGVRPRRGLPPAVADVVRPGDLRDLGAAPQRRPPGAPAARAVHGGRPLRGRGAPPGDDDLADVRPLPPRGGGGARAARRPAPAGGRRRRPVAPARAAGARGPAGVDLINGYGPTENTTFSTTHRLRDGLPAGEPSVPIGRPIADSRAYVLDRLARAAAGRVRRGALRGRRRRGARLPRPPGADRRALPARSVLGGPAGEDRLYRTGDLARLAAGRDARLPRPGATSRSRCAASASSPGRSRPRSPATRGCARRW